MRYQGKTMDRASHNRPDQEDGAPPPRSEAALDEALKQIRQSLVGLQYGQVSVFVQDGVVVQVERTERKRLRRGEP